MSKEKWLSPFKCMHCGKPVLINGKALRTAQGKWFHAPCLGPGYWMERVGRIKGVAIVSLVDGTLHSMEKGRHIFVIKAMMDEGYPTPVKGIQGFVVGVQDVFVTRNLAKIIARKHNQILPNKPFSSGPFTSEHLW